MAKSRDRNKDGLISVMVRIPVDMNQKIDENRKSVKNPVNKENYVSNLVILGLKLTEQAEDIDKAFRDNVQMKKDLEILGKAADRDRQLYDQEHRANEENLKQIAQLEKDLAFQKDGWDSCSFNLKAAETALGRHQENIDGLRNKLVDAEATIEHNEAVIADYSKRLSKLQKNWFVRTFLL